MLRKLWSRIYGTNGTGGEPCRLNTRCPSSLVTYSPPSTGSRSVARSRSHHASAKSCASLTTTASNRCAGSVALPVRPASAAVSAPRQFASLETARFQVVERSTSAIGPSRLPLPRGRRTVRACPVRGSAHVSLMKCLRSEVGVRHVQQEDHRLRRSGHSESNALDRENVREGRQRYFPNSLRHPGEELERRGEGPLARS